MITTITRIIMAITGIHGNPSSDSLGSYGVVAPFPGL